MDQREIRLQELARKIMAGTITASERQEYDTLRNQQAAEQKAAILKLARWRVRPRLPRRR